MVGGSEKLYTVCVGDHRHSYIYRYKSTTQPVESFIACMFPQSSAKHMCSKPLPKRLLSLLHYEEHAYP